MSLMNAPFVLDEIAAGLRELVETGVGRTIYLSQFPLTPEDAAYLNAFVGRGRTTIEMSGNSRTVWRETGYPGVWWGEYYGSNPAKPVLHTIEIGEIPSLAPAQLDDMAEGLERMAQALPEVRAAAQPVEACGVA